MSRGQAIVRHAIGWLVLAVLLCAAGGPERSIAGGAMDDSPASLPAELHAIHLDGTLNRVDLRGTGRPEDLIVKAESGGPAATAVTYYRPYLVFSLVDAVPVAVNEAAAGELRDFTTDVAGEPCFRTVSRFFAGEVDGEPVVYLLRATRKNARRDTPVTIEVLRLEQVQWEPNTPIEWDYRFYHIRHSTDHHGVCTELELRAEEQRALAVTLME